MKKLSKGILIALEGGEGCGKSTMVKELKEFYENNGYKVLTVREPGGVPVSEKIRNVMLYNEMDAMTELFLLAASRHELIKNVVKPALKEGYIVIMDRYLDSTYVYQGLVKGVNFFKIKEVMDIATNYLYPDVSIIIDVHPEVGLRRVADENHEKNKNDVAPLEFHKKINEAYNLILFDKGACSTYSRHMVDGNYAKDEVFRDILDIVDRIVKENEVNE